MWPMFDALRLIKGFHDCGDLKYLLEESGLEDYQFHRDSFGDFFEAAIGGAQAYYRENQSEDGYSMKIYYSHTALDDYYWLATEYGWRHDLTREENPYIRCETEFLQGFLGSVDEGAMRWVLTTNTKKPHGCGILFSYDSSYMEIDFIEFIYNLYLIHHHFAEQARKLRQILAEETEQQNWKEAA